MKAEQQIRSSLTNLIPLIFPTAGAFHVGGFEDTLSAIDSADYPSSAKMSFRLAHMLIEATLRKAENHDGMPRRVGVESVVHDYDEAVKLMNRSAFSSQVVATDLIVLPLAARQTSISIVEAGRSGCNRYLLIGDGK